MRQREKARHAKGRIFMVKLMSYTEQWDWSTLKAHNMEWKDHTYFSIEANLLSLMNHKACQLISTNEGSLMKY